MLYNAKYHYHPYILSTTVLSDIPLPMCVCVCVWGGGGGGLVYIVINSTQASWYNSAV